MYLASSNRISEHLSQLIGIRCEALLAACSLRSVCIVG